MIALAGGGLLTYVSMQHPAVADGLLFLSAGVLLVMVSVIGRRRWVRVDASGITKDIVFTRNAMEIGRQLVRRATVVARLFRPPCRSIRASHSLA